MIVKYLLNLHRNVINFSSMDSQQFCIEQFLGKIDPLPKESFQDITDLIKKGVIPAEEPNLVPKIIKSNKSYQTSLENFLIFIYKNPKVTTRSPNTFSILNFPIIQQKQEQINEINNELDREKVQQLTIYELQELFKKHNFPQQMICAVLSNNYQQAVISIQEIKEKLDISIFGQIPNHYMIGWQNIFKTSNGINFDQKEDCISDYLIPYCLCPTCSHYYDLYTIFLIIISFRQLIVILEDLHHSSNISDSLHVHHYSKAWMRIRIFISCLSMLLHVGCMDKITYDNFPQFIFDNKNPNLLECFTCFFNHIPVQLDDMKDIIFTIVLNLQILSQFDPNHKNYDTKLKQKLNLSKVLRAQTQLVQQIQNKNNFKLLIDQKDNIFKQLHIINDN